MATKVELTNAAEVDIEVIEGDKLDASNATITVKDSTGANYDMSAFSNVEFNVYRDEEFQSKILTFTNPVSMTLGDGYFILLAAPLTLVAGIYRFGLREIDSPNTLAIGHFIVIRRY